MFAGALRFDAVVLLGKIQHVYAGVHSAGDLVPDEGLHAFMQHCSQRIGEAYFRTPRNTIKEAASGSPPTSRAGFETSARRLPCGKRISTFATEALEIAVATHAGAPEKIFDDERRNRPVRWDDQRSLHTGLGVGQVISMLAAEHKAVLFKDGDEIPVVNRTNGGHLVSVKLLDGFVVLGILWECAARSVSRTAFAALTYSRNSPEKRSIIKELHRDRHVSARRLFGPDLRDSLVREGHFVFGQHRHHDVARGDDL